MVGLLKKARPLQVVCTIAAIVLLHGQARAAADVGLRNGRAAADAPGCRTRG